MGLMLPIDIIALIIKSPDYYTLNLYYTLVYDFNYKILNSFNLHKTNFCAKKNNIEYYIYRLFLINHHIHYIS